MIINTVQKSLPAIGFLTVIRDDEQGLFGGYLILNALGRPLEFHCTAPVRASRAQEILYGPTLEPYLYGERIGVALLEKSQTRPLAVFTDVEATLGARPFVTTPLMFLEPIATADPPSSTTDQPRERWRLDPPHAGPTTAAARHRFHLGPYALATESSYRDDAEKVQGCWTQFADQIRLEEPFGRIREAIDEARRGIGG